eukprot:CAMPEP_0183730194 /NCGR_PEP_ID=MMETSP0737-20130205/32188_1 /TAXON_ID=385413 /ORGANISM="Thalassiosira miniscula, Strain CCMP1093" /LENGTH=1187 /DNA_ID=CAMNT_0025962617 /DNA_START=86 /DNA_END=3646 /DNA_ORIENTATION=+
MAGFSSRLREKIESTRCTTASAQAASNYQPKNIRGLTRLGVNVVGNGVSPSGGLLRGRNSVGGNGIGDGSTGAHNASLLSQNSNRRKEDDGQHTTIAAAHPSLHLGSVAESSRGSINTAAGLDCSAALLGGSKIVPGWDAGRSDETRNAPSGHLGCIKAKDRMLSEEMKQGSTVEDPSPLSLKAQPASKTSPWALHQPSSPPTSLSQLSLSRRRWGDEEDDSDEEFPQIGSKPTTATTTNHGEVILETHQRDQHGGRTHINSISWHNIDSDNTGCKKNKDFFKHIRKGVALHQDVRGRGNLVSVQNQVSSAPLNQDTFHLEEFRKPREQGSHANGRVESSVEDTFKSSRCHRGTTTRFGIFERGHHDGNRGGRWGKLKYVPGERRLPNCDSTTSILQVRHSQGISRHVNGDFSNPGGFDDSEGRRNNSIRRTLHLRGEIDASDRAFGLHGRGPRSGHQIRGSHSRLRDEANRRDLKRIEDMSMSLDTCPNVNHQSHPSVACTMHCQLGDSSLKSHVVSGLQQKSESTADHVTPPPVHKHRASDGPTTMVLLRKNENGLAKELTTLSSSMDVSCAQNSSSEGNHLEKGEECVVFCDNSWSTGRTTEMAVSISPDLFKEEGIEKSPPLAIDVEHEQYRRCNVNFSADSYKEMDQHRFEQTMEQQQGVMRHVTECGVNAVVAIKATGWVTRDMLPANAGGNQQECSPSVCFKSLDCKFFPQGISTMSDSSQTCTRATEVILKVERVNPCRIDGHNHDWFDCPNNPKSKSFVRNNPCRIEGHNHDWNDCLDNPKSDNYARKGRRVVRPLVSHVVANRKYSPNSGPIDSGGKPPPIAAKASLDSGLSASNSLSVRCFTMHNCDSMSNLKEEMKCNSASSTAVVQKLPDTCDGQMCLAGSKQFVPAPLPRVSAWTSGPPTITNECALLPPESTKSTIPPKLSIVETLTVNSQVRSEEDHYSSSFESFHPSTHEITPSPILHHPGALLAGNKILFDTPLEPTSVYCSWNSPPLLMRSISIDPWKPNPFAQIPTTDPPTTATFECIWGIREMSLATTKSNAVRRNRTRCLDFTVPINSDAFVGSSLVVSHEKNPMIYSEDLIASDLNKNCPNEKKSTQNCISEREEMVSGERVVTWGKVTPHFELMNIQPQTDRTECGSTTSRPHDNLPRKSSTKKKHFPTGRCDTKKIGHNCGW